MKQNENVDILFKKDKFILNELKKHKSKDNPLTAKELIKTLKDAGFEEYTISGVSCRVRGISREYYLPIVHCEFGWYWATSRKDIEECIEHLQSVIEGYQKRINHLKSFLPE